MARTNNTKKRNTLRKEFKEEPKRKERKIIPSQKTIYSTIQYPPDICIVVSNNSSTFDCDCSDQVLKLGNKFMEHICSEFTCFAPLPKINWEMVCENTQTLSDSMLFEGNDDFSYICDETASEEDSKVGMNILEMVLKNIYSYSSGKLIDYETQDERIRSVTIEYSKCGSKCYYKTESNGDYEFVIILLSQDEYLAFGQIGSHAFYLLPGLEYCNSDGSTPNVCSECIEDYDEEKDVGTPKIIPLSEVLKKASNFLMNVLNNRYH